MPPAPTIRPARRGEGMTASHAAAHPEHLVATTPQHQSPRPAPAGPRSRTPSHTMKTVAEPDKTHPLTSPTLSGTTWRIPRPGEYRAPGRRAGRPDYHRPPREHGSLGCHETAARHRDRALNLFCARPARSAAPTHAPAWPGRRGHHRHPDPTQPLPIRTALQPASAGAEQPGDHRTGVLAERRRITVDEAFALLRPCPQPQPAPVRAHPPSRRSLQHAVELLCITNRAISAAERAETA